MIFFFCVYFTAFNSSGRRDFSWDRSEDRPSFVDPGFHFQGGSQPCARPSPCVFEADGVLRAKEILVGDKP